MIYIVINLILFGLMVYTSFTQDKSGKVSKINNNLVNLMLFLGFIFLLMALSLALCYWGPRQLALLCVKLTFTLGAWFSISCVNYLLLFPEYPQKGIMVTFKWIFNALAFYIMFFVPNSFDSITISKNNMLQIVSGPAFGGALEKVVPWKVSWFMLFNVFYRVLIPFFVSLMVIVRAENTRKRLPRQNFIINILGLVLSWINYIYIGFASEFQSMLLSLSMVAWVPVIFMFSFANSNTEIWDIKSVLRGSLRYILKYILPSCAAAGFFVLLWPYATFKRGFFYSLYIPAITLVVIVIGTVRKIFKNKEFLRDNHYAESFEQEITAINFDGDPKDITDKFFGIFKKYVNTSSMKILIDSGNGKLETVYSSNDEKMTLSLDNKIFDEILNAHHQIMFKEYAKTASSISSIRMDLLALMEEAQSDAFIVLNEGRQVVGLIFLGPKATGNAYSDYDYNIFNKVYSNFFVIGYYIKNIMNEAVVGTVNREIRMSGQIITSIQENMDLIKNPKLDVGYLMVPAHNIGGEFVDMIRLTDTRHIFIIGSLSGKGIAASMSMVILKSIIRTFLAETSDFKLLVEKVNSFIRESLPKGTFFAGLFGLMDFNTDTLYYINCGIPALFLYTRAYNNVIEIQGEGKILGFAKSVSNLVKVKKIKLSPGDIVMSCTDGLIESRSLRGDDFGKVRVQNSLIENLSYPAEKMCQFTHKALIDFTSKELEDDVTIVTFKYLGGK